MTEYQKLAKSIDIHWCEMAAFNMLRRCRERILARAKVSTA